MSSVSPSPASLWGSRPFDSLDDADFIVRSSDGICFPMQKIFLIHASTFYRHLLDDSTPTETLWGLPVYDVPENGLVAHVVLSLCLPSTYTTRETLLWRLSDVMQALRKYMMDGPEARVVSCLENSPAVRHFVSTPMDLFAIARVYGWTNVAREAARRTLQLPLKGIEELDQISASDYLRLKEYHAMSKKAAVGAVTSFEVGPPRVAFVFQALPLGFNTIASEHAADILAKSQICELCLGRSDLYVTCFMMDRTKVRGWAHYWVVDLLRDVRAKLEDAPGVGILREDMDKAFYAAGKACLTQTPKGVRDFMTMLEAVIEDALSQVKAYEN